MSGTCIPIYAPLLSQLTLSTPVPHLQYNLCKSCPFGDADHDLSTFRSKTKCSEDYPACERCEKKRLPCSYTTDKRHTRRSNTSVEHNGNFSVRRDDLGHDEASSRGFRGIQDASDLKHDGLSLFNLECLNEEVMAGRNFDTSEPVEALEGPLLDLSPWPQAALSQFIGVGDFYPTLLSPSAWDGAFEQSISGLRTNTMAPTETMVNATEFTTSTDSCLDAAGTAFDSALQPLCSAVMGPLGLATGIRRQQGRYRSNGDDANVTTAASYDRAIVTATTTEHESGPENSLPALVDDLGSNRSGYPRRFLLPSVDSTTQGQLLTCLRLPLTRSPWQSMSLTSFPSKEQLDYFLDLYFGHFDMVGGL